MGASTFRFVAWSDGMPMADAQFWRDVDASDRLASAAQADRYLRDLCRSRAAGQAAEADDRISRDELERALLCEVAARGYRLSESGVDMAGHDRRASN